MSAKALRQETCGLLQEVGELGRGQVATPRDVDLSFYPRATGQDPVDHVQQSPAAESSGVLVGRALVTGVCARCPSGSADTPAVEC